MMKRSLLAAAVLAMTNVSAAATAATVVGATHLTVKSAVGDYLQVGELLAFDFGAVNVALASNGGVATAASQYPAPEGGGAAEAIDGAFPVAYDYAYSSMIPGVYHSAGTGAGEYLTVAFAGATTLSKIQIYGRGDCCAGRDLYNVTIYGAGDAVLFSGQLDARTAGNASILFDAPSGVVPEPASWALLILGFGVSGALLRSGRSTGLPVRQA